MCTCSVLMYNGIAVPGLGEWHKCLGKIMQLTSMITTSEQSTPTISILQMHLFVIFDGGDTEITHTGTPKSKMRNTKFRDSKLQNVSAPSCTYIDAFVLHKYTHKIGVPMLRLHNPAHATANLCLKNVFSW